MSREKIKKTSLVVTGDTKIYFYPRRFKLTVELFYLSDE